MATDVDQQIERAREAMARIASAPGGRTPGGPRRRRAAHGTSAAGRFALIVMANIAILIAAAVAGLVIDLGMLGGLLVLAAMVAVTLAIALAPKSAPPSETKLRTVDLKALPAQTERWLAAQRPNLPASARSVADRIGERLESLSPQLGRVDGNTETALEIRRLVGEQLPAFVADYARVPTDLRSVERNGRTPDAELVAGLRLIEQEIADMTARLAQSDLDSLQTRGRFLEIKYQDSTDT
ncbi:hypothetical protein [Sphingomonas aerophila]|uniref:Uncharacterized protein n=1 Tax=Sphingomonas aerophila TaxID=1344948 RepID=A0A7W9BCC1_9SPHN|nr:hypothetical protein [Sphingomonas aerophila]